MAGPRSKGCNLCKIRKMKCDERWPVCSPCRRKNLTCPGPTPLVSFKSESAGLRASHAVSHSRLITPRPPPSSPADRVAAQVVSQLSTVADRGIIQARYLMGLPSRMSQHQSLRDSTSLYYTVWSNFCRQKPPVEFIYLPEYGRAINSLRQVLGTKQARTPETLASVAILHFTEELFNPSPTKLLHASGMASLVAAIGPPKPDDQYYKSILSDVYNFLFPYIVMKRQKDKMIKKSKGNSMQPGWLSFSNDEKLNEQMLPALQLCGDLTDRMPYFARGCQALWNPSASKYLDKSSASIAKEIRQAAGKVDTVLAAVLSKCVELGEVIEEEDPHSLSGTSYVFPSSHLGHTLLHMHCFQVCLSRMRYDQSVFYNRPDADAHYAKLKELCVHIWKYMRFLLALEPSLAAATPRGLYFTMEMADTDQKNFLLDAFTELDIAIGKLPTHRDIMEAEILFFGRVWSGRRP